MQGEQPQVGMSQNAFLCLFVIAWFTVFASMLCALAATEKL